MSILMNFLMKKILHVMRKFKRMWRVGSDYWGLSGKSLIVNSIDKIDSEKQIVFCRPEQSFTDYIDEHSSIETSETFVLLQ